MRNDLEDFPNDVAVAGEAASGEQALELVDRLRPDVILMDIQMRGMDGITATRLLRERHPDGRIILLTNHDEPEYVLKGIRAGAVGYVLKEGSGEELIAAITAAYDNGTPLSATVATTVREALLQHAPRQPPVIDLSDVEVDILRGIAQGRDSSELAEQIGLSEGTIKQYTRKIVTKLGARDRAHAVALVKDWGLI